METVKRARKIMKFLLIVPTCFCLLGIAGYFLKGKGDPLGDSLGLLSLWTGCSLLLFNTAEGAIKTLEQEIESLKSDSSTEPSDPTPPEDK
jgi:hypothetical protein